MNRLFNPCHDSLEHFFVPVRVPKLMPRSCVLVQIDIPVPGFSLQLEWRRWPGAARQQLSAHGPPAFELEKGRLQSNYKLRRLGDR